MPNAPHIPVPDTPVFHVRSMCAYLLLHLFGDHVVKVVSKGAPSTCPQHCCTNGNLHLGSWYAERIPRYWELMTFSLSLWWEDNVVQQLTYLALSENFHQVQYNNRQSSSQHMSMARIVNAAVLLTKTRCRIVIVHGH